MRLILSIFRLLFIGACALALMAQTRMVFGMSDQPGFLDGFVLGGSVFGYYNTHPDLRLRGIAWALGFFGGVCLFFWIVSGGALMLVLVPVLCWLAYYGFRRPGNAGLRTWLLAKPLTVALAWAWVTVVLPAADEVLKQILPVFLERSAFVFALALAYDVSDMPYDRLYGLKTLARALDTKRTFWLIQLGFGLSGMCIGVSFVSGFYGLSLALSLLISLIFSAWWVQYLLHKNAWLPWHKVLIDALMPLQCALVLLLR